MSAMVKSGHLQCQRACPLCADIVEKVEIGMTAFILSVRRSRLSAIYRLVIGLGKPLIEK